MKNIFQTILSYFLIALLLYIILSIIHLSWYIANPVGFFGFNYFVEVVRMVLTILTSLVILFFGILFFILTLVSLFQGKETIKNVIKTIAFFLFIAFMNIFDSLWINGYSYLFASEMSEKYSLINQTEEYLEDGKIEKALEFAIKAYKKEQNREMGWFFIFTKLYSLTDFDRKEKLISKYSATLNYGYALKGLASNGQTGEEKFFEAISIANENLLKEEKNELLIFPTLSLAEINLRSENFKLADEYFNVLLDLQQEGKTEDVLYLINTYMLFATKASAIGDFSKSIMLQEEVLNLYEESELNKNSTNYLSLLLAVSAGKIYNKNFTSAADLLVKAQPIAENKDDTSIYLNYLSIKGSYCLFSALHKQGDERLIDKSFWDNIMGSSDDTLSLENRLLNQAEDCFIELLESSKVISGTDSVYFLNAIVTLANFYYLTSQFNKAKINFDKALTLIKSSNKNNETFYHEIYLKSLLNKSRLTKVEINELVEVENFIFKKIRQNFSVLAEEEKEIYAMRMQRFINLVNKFYVIDDSEKSRERLYNNIISIKSLALSSNKAIREYIKKADNELKARYINLLKEKKEFKMRSFGFKDLQEENELINKEKELLQQIYDDPHFKEYLPKFIDWKDIRNALNPNEVAIEFINLNQSEGTDQNPQYYALIVGQNYLSPKLIKLFREKDLRDLINVQGVTKNRVNTIYTQNHKKLYNLIFKPIDQFLKDDTRVYISKSGLLHNISFSALFKDKSWDVYILQNTKDITEGIRLKSTNSVALFGGIDYGIDSINYSRNTKLNKTLKRRYKNLNYTLSEVTDISKLFLNNSNSSTKIYSNYNASESSFRELSGSETDIIHIATHGYYNKGNDFNSFIYTGLENGQFESIPLLRSGLLFAGANNSSFNTKNNDGIMTSLEISEMDLSKVDLVVLSACETGLGDVLGSEGVFGLQRAFKLAGAKSLIVSLWQVPDKQTAELMLKFYDYYLSGSSKTEALKKAQNDIKKDYSNPYYWAGFELIQ